jgi:hypothetical protein
MNPMTTPANGNYRLVKVKKVSEINSEVFVYEHVKTGARLLYIKNDDTNKVFSITFKTPPVDDTGCPHILEHSVLNGSKNFPAKNTFTELMKGSMKTFLNAFTASDKTSYPIASTNEQDFYNLMHVYLDAVLYPNIYDSADVLKQEGWHHELFKPEDPIVYRGVVYNEMKGAFSSPETVLFRKNQHVQFPDTPYGFESGGDPEAIPQLTWDDFKAFHTRLYHPSNSWIYLYGDLDIDKALAFIDEKYLSAFDKTVPDSDIPLQKPFEKPVKVEESYSIGEDENPEGKNILSLNFTCSTVLDVSTTTAMSTLKQILLDSAASPLKLAIQQSNLCADNFAYYDDSCLQPTLSIFCKNVKDENIEPLIQLIYGELERIAKDGIDKKLIEGIINIREFHLREAEMGGYPKGLFYNSVATKSWLHGGDPFSYLEFEPIVAELRKGLTEPMFEQLIDRYLLKNNHSSTIIMRPVRGLVKQTEEKAGKILAEYKASLTGQEISELIEDNKRLQHWQSIPDTPEDIEKIPFISLQDIKKEAEKLPLETEQTASYTLLKHDVFTNGVVYLSAYMDISHLNEEELNWLALINELIGSLDTENYSFGDISNEIYIHTGGVATELSLNTDFINPDNIVPKLAIRTKCVLSKVDKMLELAGELTFKTVFTNMERIHQLIREQMSGLQMSFMNAGHMTAIRRMLGQTSRLHKWQDMTQGMAMFSFLSELEKKMTSNPQEVADKLTQIARKALRRDNLIISLTSPEADINQVKGKLDILANLLTNSNAAAAAIEFSPVKKNEGIIAPINVQFCAQGGNFLKAGFGYKGQMMVLENILRNDFLMQELRVKGGAYGIMVQFLQYGQMYFCSYRDPNLKETLDTYGKVADYLKSFDCSPRDFEKYIIGTMANLDRPLTPSQKGSNSDLHFLTNYSFADRQKLRDEVLGTKIEDIRAFADLVDAVMKQHQIAVFGTESKLRENSQLFDSLVPVIPYG